MSGYIIGCKYLFSCSFYDFDDQFFFVWQSLVHSANAWESSDLGNDGRKQKFLRLMGADKVM